jgi:hypothetical protein
VAASTQTLDKNQLSVIASSRESLNRNREILAKKNKMPTLADQMEVVDEWWREVDPQKKLEVPIEEVA